MVRTRWSEMVALKHLQGCIHRDGCKPRAVGPCWSRPFGGLRWSTRRQSQLESGPCKAGSRNPSRQHEFTVSKAGVQVCFNRGNVCSREHDDRLGSLSSCSNGKLEEYCTIESEQDRSSRGPRSARGRGVRSKGQWDRQRERERCESR